MKISAWIMSSVILLAGVSTKVSASTVEKYLEQASKKASQGELETAAVLYQKILKLDEKNLKARKGLAAVLMEARMDDLDAEHSGAELAVIQEATTGTPLAPTQFPLHYLSNAALGPSDEPLNFEVLLALTQLHKGDNDSAIKTANELQRRTPKNPVSQNLLGLAWSAKGEFKKARQHYQKALSLRPDFQAARINLAELDMCAKDYAKARQALTQILKEDRHNRRACLAMARLCSLEDKLEEAKGWYQQASKRY